MGSHAVMLFGDSMLARFTKRRICHLEQEIGADLLPSVLNCAVGGWDSGDGLRGASHLARVAAPFVVLSLGMNDCAPWKLVPAPAFSRNLAALRQAFAGSHVIGFLPPSISEQPDPDSNHRTNLILDVYREAMRDALQPELCLDVNKILEDSKFATLDEDGIHLTDESYSALIPHLGKLIRTTYSRPFS